MPRLQPESTISHYKIKELIASGGMGEVYRAIDLQLGRVIALKTILSVRADDSDTHRRFLREARAASILSHPSICTIYEIGQEGDLTFIAMQYIGGKTIQDILSKEQLPLETVLSYALDVTEALEEAHRHGVVHRDIKPSNIMTNERGIAVVLDFGLAKKFSFAGPLNDELSTLVNLTSDTAIPGTVPYMSPEQIRGEPLDGRSDIFSFGITLYEMLSRALPFRHPSKIEVLHSILHDDPTPLTGLRAEVDQRLADIVSKALEKNPSERYQSAGEFKTEILAYIQDNGFKVRGVSTTSSHTKLLRVRRSTASERLSKISGSRVSPIFLRRLSLVLLGVAGLVGVWWFLLRNPGRPDSDLILSLQHAQLTSWKSEPGEGDIFSSLSRDGTMIAYSFTGSGYASIWIKQTLGGNPFQVTKDESYNLNPIWSPDNQQLAFVSKRGGLNGVWRVTALGGTPKLVAEFKGSLAPQLKSWSKDGATIYYELDIHFFGLDVATGRTIQLTNFEPSEPSAQLNFRISPNEDRIVYVDQKDGSSDLWVVPIRGGPPVRVTNDAAEDKNPVWWPDGERIVYSSLRDGTYQICIAYLDGRKPVQITSGEGDKVVSDVSADGTKILYNSSKEESDIWGVKVDSGEEFEVTSDIGFELWPDVSPDNKMVAFQATKDPGLGRNLLDCLILIKPAQNADQPIQVGTGRDPRWSPDGKKLALVRGWGNAMNIWTVDASGGFEKQVTKEGIWTAGFSLMPYNRHQTRDYSWSPDSKDLVYCRGKTPNDFSVEIISADGSGEARIINSAKSDVFYSPLWSADGARVIYLSKAKTNSPDGKPLWKVWLTEIGSGKSEILFQGDSVLRLLGWAGSGKDVVIATIEGRLGGSNAATVSLIRLGAGVSRSIGRSESTYLYNIQLSPDGQLIAFSSQRDGRDNVWLIPAAGGEPRKLTTNADPRLYFSSMTWSPDGKTIYYGKQSRYSLISAVVNFK